MKVYRLTSLAAPALSLLGCAAPHLNEAGYLGQYQARAPAVSSVMGAESRVPLARLPAAAGGVVAIRQSDDGRRLTQEIILAGNDAVPGENKIVVTVADPRDPATRATEAEIEADLAREFPGVAMRIGSQGLASSLGTLSVAAGSQGRTHCLYAWHADAPTAPSLFASDRSATSSVAVRLRLCRDLASDRLADLARDLIVMPAGRGPASEADAGTPDGEDSSGRVTASVDDLPLPAVESRSGQTLAMRGRVHAGQARMSGGTSRRKRARELSAGDPRVATMPVRDIPLPDDVMPSPHRSASIDTHVDTIETKPRPSDLPFPAN